MANLNVRNRTTLALFSSTFLLRYKGVTNWVVQRKHAVHRIHGFDVAILVFFY